MFVRTATNTFGDKLLCAIETDYHHHHHHHHP